MNEHGLFGHLAMRFSAHPENLATEALHYVLSGSDVARSAFVRYFNQAGLSLPEMLTFQTQDHAEDQAIPDLVGLDTALRPVLICEAKFWAGLTDNQPVTYVRRLPKETDSILAFIAPGRRIAPLWPELLRRCQCTEIAVSDARQLADDYRVAKLGPQQLLAIVSWASLLDALLRPLELQHQSTIAADVAQLRGSVRANGSRCVPSTDVGSIGRNRDG